MKLALEEEKNELVEFSDEEENAKKLDEQDRLKKVSFGDHIF